MPTHKILSGLVFGITLLLAGCSDSTTTAPDPEPQETGLNTTLLDSLFLNFAPAYNYTDEPTHMLGHAARVSAPGLDAWTAAAGVVDSLDSDSVSINSVFRIGSITKVFTATVILQLWEEGLVDLDSSFNHYLGLDSVTYPKIVGFEEVTLRQLLSHRSGLPYISSTTFFDVYDYADSIAQTERLKFLFTEGEPDFAPGAQYAYRNSNFNILGLVIESVCAGQYHEILQQRIYSPIGLENTHLLDFDMNRDDSRLAHGYFYEFDGTHYHGSHAWAAGGLVSTVQDLTTFMRALVDGQLFQMESTFGLMTSPPTAGAHYGLGIFMTQTQQGLSYGHGGGIFGFYTKLEYFPQFDAIVTSAMTFNGIDFVATNWLADFCVPVVAEVRRILN